MLKDETYTRAEIVDAFKKVAFNSTFMCLAAFGVVNLLHNLIWYMGAYHYVQEPVLLHNYVVFVKNEGWYVRAVKNIYSAGPYLCIALAAISYAVYTAIPKKRITYRMFWFWLFINSINYLLVQWLATPYIRNSGIGVLTHYWYWEERDRFIAALVALVIAFFYGRFIAHNFLQFTPAMKYMKRNNYRIFAFYVLVIPAVALMVAVPAFRMFFEWRVVWLMVLVTFLLALSVLVRIGERKFKVQFFEESYKAKYSYGGVIFLGIIVAINIYLYLVGFRMEPGLF
ncbi:MAG: hypothetical protein M0D57_04445 [Sphingobacteriales bacterium JAD_PAG50586_3]|nr:MAG: hypothetical protein M0D57_04445 [Sphingobacteriales bacterium JAD_PAG50586_3]